MCTKYHFIMPVIWYENHHKLTTKGSYISTKHTYKASTLYLSEDMGPCSTYTWHRSWTSSLINSVWFYPFLISFSCSLLHNAGHSTSYGRNPTSVSLCSCVLCKDRRTILHLQHYTHTSGISVFCYFYVQYWLFPHPYGFCNPAK
jgi:hypothetical protein